MKLVAFMYLTSQFIQSFATLLILNVAFDENLMASIATKML